MKTGLLQAVLAIFAVSAFGQGTIAFRNHDLYAYPGPVNAPIYLDFVGGTLIDGSNSTFRAALLGGPTNSTPAYIPGSRTNGPSGGTPVEGTLSLLASPATGTTWVTFRTGAGAGWVAAGTDYDRDSGLPFSSLGMFQVVAWAGAFDTWDSAYAAWASGTNASVFVGASNPIMQWTISNPTAAFTPSLQGLESFSLQVPEPATASLLTLAAVGWLLMAWRGRRFRA